MSEANGQKVNPEIPEKIPGTISCNVQPFPSIDDTQGATLSLIDHDSNTSLGATLGPAQCREIAARLLLCADAADQKTRTIMMVTLKSAWLPHQVLQVRDTPTGEFHYEFLIKSQLAVPEKAKLIIPG